MSVRASNLQATTERDLLESSAPYSDTITLDFLYRKYASGLRNFCRSRLGGDPEAEDACHEAILRAHRALPSFRPGPLWPWLSTIAANVCIDIQRKSRRLVGLEGHLDDRDAVEDPEAEAMQNVRAGIVREAMRLLPERYSTLIQECDFEGWSYEQMARVHGTTVAAVDSALVRARRALKTLVEKVARKQGWPLP